MAKVILLDSGRRAFAEALQALQKVQVKHMCIAIYHEEEEEEFLFWGHPAKIYQMLSLAKAHILQTHPLLESCDLGGEG